MATGILIDGPYFAGAQRSLKVSVDVGQFARKLFSHYAPVTAAIYYAGSQVQEATLGTIVGAGYQVRGEFRGRGAAQIAKYVDVQIAVDMIQIAESADRIALVSGDNDFSYSVRAVVNKGIPVDIVALTPAMGRRLVEAGGTVVDLMTILGDLASEPIDADFSTQERALWTLKGLSAKHRKDVRALWCGVQLERALRHLCDMHGISLSPNEGIDGLSGKLLRAGAYPKLVHKKVTVYADIRNNAAHGHFEQYTERDVDDMEKWVDNFVRGA